MSTRQEEEDTDLTEEGADPGTTSTQLKRPRVTQRSRQWKKVKASKLAIDAITLTEGNLYDIDDMVREITKEALQEVMTEQQTMLGTLRAQLQELKVRPPQEGILSTHVAAGTSTVEKMLHVRMANTTVLSEGALVSTDAMD